jgi:hypothetical protein
MPRERITQTSSPFDVVVAWGRDTQVQVATTATDADERLRNWVETDSGTPPRTGDPTGTEPGTSFRMFDGWHTTLDRAGINKLIQVLRRARDQAFGRDE